MKTVKILSVILVILSVLSCAKPEKDDVIIEIDSAPECEEQEITGYGFGIGPSLTQAKLSAKLKVVYSIVFQAVGYDFTMEVNGGNISITGTMNEINTSGRVTINEEEITAGEKIGYYQEETVTLCVEQIPDNANPISVIIEEPMSFEDYYKYESEVINRIIKQAYAENYEEDYSVDRNISGKVYVESFSLELRDDDIYYNAEYQVIFK